MPWFTGVWQSRYLLVFVVILLLYLHQGQCIFKLRTLSPPLSIPPLSTTALLWPSRINLGLFHLRSLSGILSWTLYMADFLFRFQIKTHFQKALNTFTARGVGFPGQSCKLCGVAIKKKKKKKKMEGGYDPRNAGASWSWKRARKLIFT